MEEAREVLCHAIGKYIRDFNYNAQSVGEMYDSVGYLNIIEDEYEELSDADKLKYTLNPSTEFADSANFYTNCHYFNHDGSVGYLEKKTQLEYDNFDEETKETYYKIKKMYTHKPVSREQMIFEYREYAAYERPLQELRSKRDELLQDTDKYAIPDWPHATSEVRQAWLDYRQALRELPSSTDDVSNPTWPTPPTG
jgi:uncharacterized protein YjiS (DUF1127 family)